MGPALALTGGSGIDTVHTVLAWFTALFFVPALVIRYPGTAAWLGQLSAAVLVGAVAAAAAFLPPPSYPEVRILLAVALFLSAAVGTCAGIDALLARRRR